MSSAQTWAKPLQSLGRKPRGHNFVLEDPEHILFLQAASTHPPSLTPLEQKPHVEGVSSACISKLLTNSQKLQGKNIRSLGEGGGSRRRFLSCTWPWALGLLFVLVFCDESCHLSRPIASPRSWHPLADDSIWKPVLIGLCSYLLHTQTSLSHSRLLSKRKCCQKLIWAVKFPLRSVHSSSCPSHCSHDSQE